MDNKKRRCWYASAFFVCALGIIEPHCQPKSESTKASLSGYDARMLGSSSKVSVRKSEPSDADDLAKIFCQTWQETYNGIIPHHYLQTMVCRRNKRWWERTIRAGCNILVVESPAGLAGYATWAPTRTLHACQGEIYELYVRPSHQGCGFGELLFEGCRAELDQLSRNGLVVWSLLDNTLAIEFYWRRGGRPVARAFDRLGGAQLEKIAFRWD